MKEINIGLIQIGDSFGDNQYYLPYSVGLLQVYAQKYAKQSSSVFAFDKPIFRRLSVSSAVELLLDKHIALFSVYLWNFRLSLAIAERLKKLNPHIIVVFGGPQVPESKDALEKFLRKYQFIDIASYGEGERSALSILENFQIDWKNMCSVAYLDKEKNFIFLVQAERIAELDIIPSPYLDGVFDELIAANPDINWSVMWETNRGCPFGCSFCAWGASSKRKVFHYSDDRLSREIDWFVARKIWFVFCCDANFGMFPRDIQIAKKVANYKTKTGYPKAFSAQNTKNSKEDIFELQKVLNEAGLQRGVNLALQSVNPQTLKSIKRSNISADVYNDLQLMFAKDGIPTYSDIILALPDETYESLTEGVSSIIASGQHNRVQFINLTILENTEMSNADYINKYGLVIKKSKIIFHHTSLNETEEVYESQDFVVGTKSMPKNRWIESRVFCWLTSLLYFNKLLQIPIMIIGKVCDISIKEIIELFMYRIHGKPTLLHILELLKAKAEDITNGECEFVASKDALNLWWPIEEFIFLSLVKDNLLDSFYAETKELFSEFLRDTDLDLALDAIDEALFINKKLIKRPFVFEDENIKCRFNTLEFYSNLLVGRSIELEESFPVYLIKRRDTSWCDWDKWYTDVVWYGTKKGACLYEWSLVSYRAAINK